MITSVSAAVSWLITDHNSIRVQTTSHQIIMIDMEHERAASLESFGWKFMKCVQSSFREMIRRLFPLFYAIRIILMTLPRLTRIHLISQRQLQDYNRGNQCSLIWFPDSIRSSSPSDSSHFPSLKISLHAWTILNCPSSYCRPLGK